MGIVMRALTDRPPRPVLAARRPTQARPRRSAATQARPRLGGHRPLGDPLANRLLGEAGGVGGTLVLPCLADNGQGWAQLVEFGAGTNWRTAVARMRVSSRQV